MTTAESKQKSLVTRYMGKDPSAVDPYWDFEHLPGEPFDASGLRLWRLRVFVSKPARARLSIERTEDEAERSGDEPKQHRLSAHEHILRYNGGPEREASSYDRLLGSLVEVTPPSTIFVVNLSRLGVGAFVVLASVLGAQQQEREMKFSIVRRPFYTYPGLLPGKAPVVRSHTGTQRVMTEGRTVQVVSYRWHTERWEWASSQYASSGERLVEARATLGIGTLRWEVADSGSLDPEVGKQEREWSDYSTSAGTGLKTPTLVGLMPK